MNGFSKVLEAPATNPHSVIARNAGRILAAMQRAGDTEWISPREIQAERVRARWATAQTIREALNALLQAGLVFHALIPDRSGIGRPRYKLTEAGTNLVIHFTHTTREARQPVEKTFNQLWGEANKKAPEGQMLILVDRWALANIRGTSPDAPPTPPAF